MTRLYLFVAIVFVTLNLRPALVTIGPVLPLVGSSLALPATALGFLTSLPILMLGAAGSIAEPFGRRVGWSGGIVVALGLVACGTVLRSTGSVPALFAGAVILGTGIGIGNVFVPTLLKWGFAQRLGLMMGVYTCALAFGAMVSVGITPFFLQIFHDDWKPTLGVWALPAVLGALLWIPLVRLHGKIASLPSVPLWRNRLAWAVTAYMGFQSMMFYSLASWYAALLHARGLSVALTSLNLSILFVTQMVFALIVPIVLVRTSRQDIFGVALPGVVAIGIVGALYGPFAWIPLWSTIIGLALGGVFGVALSFMVLRARRVESAARLSGMAQTVGYVFASLGPLGIGLLQSAPDPRLATTVWLVLLACITMTFGAIAGQNAFVEGESALT
ncbi:MAG TPA: MFS transporter [Candidatus Acidoferrales bacterium]|nr:MFS transporter [Candidatus Acidoferrales bacterium]